MTDLLSDVLAASIDGLCAFDREHRCTVWSPAMERLTGVRASDAQGRTRGDLLPDSKQHPFTLAYSPASDGGVIGVARKTEEGVTELLSLASHKLKTPLTALQIHLGAQLRAVQSKQPEREWLERSTAAAIEQSMRLADTINMLVDVSKIDSGRWKLEYQDFELAALTRSTVDRLRHTARENGCEVRCDIEGDTQGRWDRMRLEEVLANLLANAFKHGAGKPVEVALKDTGRDVELSIADHGAGIPADEMGHVFERAPRTALGLWVAKEIIEAHRGSISVASREGAGATFTITLPKLAA